MKVVRKLAYRGNSLYVQVPKEMAIALRWEGGDSMIVEVSSTSTLRVRRVEVADLRDAKIGPMNLQLPHAATK